MDNIVQVGIAGVTELPRGLQWNSRSGDRVTRTWEGPLNAIIGLKAQLQAPNVQIDISPNGALYRLQAQFGDAQDGEDPDSEERVNITWDLTPQETQLSIYELAREKGFPPSVLSALKIAVAAASQGFASVSAQDSAYEDASLALGIECAAINFNPIPAIELLDLILGGTDSYAVEPVLIRKVKSAPAGYIGPISINVNKIYTYASLLLAEPGIGPNIIANIPGPGSFWLKKRPTINIMANGSQQITQEYQFTDHFSEFIYGPAL